MPFEIRKSKTKFAILGTGDGWNLFPPSSNKTIYALNDYIYQEKYGVQPDMLFIMDVLDEKPQIVSGINNLGNVIERINKMKVPLIAPFKYAEIPLSQPFPLEKCIKTFGFPYFTNTICYMIAYALLQGAEEISTYGINQASSSEYFYEKPGVEYWLGIALGKGVKITINGARSELINNRMGLKANTNILYGYAQPYESFLQDKERFGEPIVKKLMDPSPPKSKVVKQIWGYDASSSL